MEEVVADDKRSMDGGAALTTNAGDLPTPSDSPTCPLCFEADLSDPSMRAAVLSACGHRSCSACLTKWIEREEDSGATTSPGCPFCRSPIGDDDIRDILGRPFRLRTAVESSPATEEIDDLMDDLTRQWMEEHTVLCPGCGYPVEKNGGCNYIECLCGYIFCYDCGRVEGACDCDSEPLEGDEFEQIDLLRDAEGWVDFRACIERRRVQEERRDRRWEREDEEDLANLDATWLFLDRGKEVPAMRQLLFRYDVQDTRYLMRCSLRHAEVEGANSVDIYIRSGAWLFQNSSASKSEASLCRLEEHSRKIRFIPYSESSGENSHEEDDERLLESTLFVFPEGSPALTPASVPFAVSASPATLPLLPPPERLTSCRGSSRKVDGMRYKGRTLFAVDLVASLLLVGLALFLTLGLPLSSILALNLRALFP